MMKDAKLTESDEQSYAISVLPDYTLTSEEPGKDSLFQQTTNLCSCALKRLPRKTAHMTILARKYGCCLEASSDGSTPIEVTDEASIPTGEGIENAKVLSVKAETASVTGIIFERGDMIVRLTIYDSPKEEHFEISFVWVKQSLAK